MAVTTNLDLATAMRDVGTASHHLDAVVAQVKAAMANRITVMNVVLFITYTMQTVQQIGGLSGPEKKQLALAALEMVLDEVPFSEGDRMTITVAVQMLAPSLIDTLVAAAKSQYNFGKIAEHARSFWTSCCGRK